LAVRGGYNLVYSIQHFLTGSEANTARRVRHGCLKQRKKEIRASAQPWPVKKILLAEAVAASVIELRALKMYTQKTCQAQFPKNLRTWVADHAAEGDARAAALLRGWRFADQRNQRRLDARLKVNGMPIDPPPDHGGSTDWNDLTQQRLANQQKEQSLTNQIAATRVWQLMARPAMFRTR
jgi:hypothetical protein